MQAQKPARIVLDAGVMPEIAHHERVAPTSPGVDVFIYEPEFTVLVVFSRQGVENNFCERRWRREIRRYEVVPPHDDGVTGIIVQIDDVLQT